MTKNKGLFLGVAVLGALLLAGLKTDVAARAINSLYGDRLWVETTPRSGTPGLATGDNDAYIKGDLEVDGAATVASTFTVTPPATQTIAAGGIVAANACGTLKRITSASAVTTDTTDAIATPSASNSGCCMDIVYTGTETVTLDANAKNDFQANIVLGSGGSVRVCSDGTKWYSIGTWTEF